MPQVLSSLPLEVLIEICEHLPLADLARLVRTSTSFAWIGTPRLYDVLLLTNALPISHLSRCLKRFQSRFIGDYFRKRAERLLGTQRYNGTRGESILHHLSREGNSFLLDVLLAKGADISVRDNDGLTPFHVALEEDREDIATHLMGAGADILTPARGKVTLAFVDVDTSEAFLERLVAAIKAAGGDLSHCTPDGHTALHHASRVGNLHLVQILVANGADVFASNKYSHPPLVYSVIHMHDEISKILLNEMESDPRRYDINEPIAPLSDVPQTWAPHNIALFSSPGYTILHCAICTWNESTIALLLAHGANPIAQSNPSGDIDNITPFDIAIRGRCPKIVALITGMKNPPAFWPSTWAIQDGFETSVREAYPGTVRVLCDLYQQGKVELDLAKCARIMVETCDYYGMHRPDDDINDTVYCLIDAGADVNARNDCGETCLHQLCKWEDEHEEARFALARYLLDHGADWRLRGENGDTIFHRAVSVDQLERFIPLIAQCLAPDTTIASSDHARQNMLHASTLKLLHDAAFDPNAANNLGETLAHVAMHPRVSEELLEYLVSLGVNLSQEDNNGNPPIHYAATERWIRGESREEVIRYLVRREESLHTGCSECEAAIGKVFQGGHLLV
ncbi:ankyrin repeat-containing domain protein [Aspergillus pseudoustus]|uniref:Ankyrin repeat-containing domain protein n=1 Tax=Aspergillus pseudoustus TaxID=1810923 RepID=A0ABR4KIA5_9EURO